MRLVKNLPAIPTEKTTAPQQATEELPIAKADNTMDTNIHNIMKVFKAWNPEEQSE